MALKKNLIMAALVSLFAASTHASVNDNKTCVEDQAGMIGIYREEVRMAHDISRVCVKSLAEPASADHLFAIVRSISAEEVFHLPSESVYNMMNS